MSRFVEITHRSFNGLKPAGLDLGSTIPAADKALETGAVEPLLKLLTDKVQDGMHEHFTQAMAKKKLDEVLYPTAILIGEYLKLKLDK